MIFTRSILPKKTHSDNHTNENNFKLVLVHNSVPLGYTHSQKSFGFLCSSFKLDRHFDFYFWGILLTLEVTPSWLILKWSKSLHVVYLYVFSCITKFFYKTFQTQLCVFLWFPRTHSSSYLNYESISSLADKFLFIF